VGNFARRSFEFRSPIYIIILPDRIIDIRHGHSESTHRMTLLSLSVLPAVYHGLRERVGYSAAHSRYTLIGGAIWMHWTARERLGWDEYKPFASVHPQVPVVNSHYTHLNSLFHNALLQVSPLAINGPLSYRVRLSTTLSPAIASPPRRRTFSGSPPWTILAVRPGDGTCSKHP